MSRPVWRTVHTDIDGVMIDRERGYPDLELTLEPMGRALPTDQQTRHLTLRIGKAETVINEDGIAALQAFLNEVP